jgi:agmatinase
LTQIKNSHKKITKYNTTSSKNGTIPRIVTLGGDHTITLPALRAIHTNFGKVAVLHFDSHLDTWDPEVLSNNQSAYAAINHGTFLHIAHEEGLLLDGKNMHAGIRTQLESMADISNDKRCGFDIVYANDIDRVGIQGVIKRIKTRVGEAKLYISVDIDVLDPAYAPATYLLCDPTDSRGTPEIGGWTTRELTQILRGLEGVNVVGADVVEVAPVYDTQAELTGLAAAGVVEILIELMVKKPVGDLEDRK